MDLVTTIRQVLPEGANVRDLSDGIVNIYARNRELTDRDVDAARSAITQAGYGEDDSWIAREGMSWLSDGLISVSFKVRPL